MRTLLIADDERTIREGIANSVDWQSLGISRVLLAADGKEAYETIIAERPDIAVIDIVMPEMTGIEVISRFGDDEDAPVFVIISGYSEFDYAQEAIRHNVKDYILKPLDCNEIADTIRAIISRIERRQSKERERVRLQEYLDSLMPQAQEQALRDLLLSGSKSDCQLFHRMFGECCEEYQLLLFSFEDPDHYSQLPVLRECVETSPSIKGWKFTVILRDCVVLLFDADSGTDAGEVVSEICSRAAQEAVTGIRAAISARGAASDLSSMYRQAWDAVRLFSPSSASGGDESHSAPLIDASTSKYSKPVRQVIQYVKGHLDDSDLSLSHIATDVLFLNPDYLGRLFKKECGVKFSDYLMTARMEKAKQIIARSRELKIYEVAQRVGLGTNVAYFGQVFRKYTGMRPSDYRAKVSELHHV